MKKFLALFGAVGLTATSSMAVVACGNKEDKTNNFADGKIIKDLKELSKSLTGTPSEAVILAAFNAVNKDVLKEEVKADHVTFGTVEEVKDNDGKITGYKVEITANTGDKAKFEGKVTVSFTVAAKFDLAHLPKFDFENIESDNALTAQEVLDKLNENNKGLDLKLTTDVTIETITDTGATVKAVDASTKVKGQVNVKFNRTAKPTTPTAAE